MTNKLLAIVAVAILASSAIAQETTFQKGIRPGAENIKHQPTGYEVRGCADYKMVGFASVQEVQHLDRAEDAGEDPGPASVRPPPKKLLADGTACPRARSSRRSLPSGAPLYCRAAASPKFRPNSPKTPFAGRLFLWGGISSLQKRFGVGYRRYALPSGSQMGAATSLVLAPISLV